MSAAPFPSEVTEMMAKREHRMHHWLWHEVRNNWNQYPKDVQDRIEQLGWRPPRPLQDELGRPQLHNGAGEDFLYMHRQMIADVNAVLAQVGDRNYPRVEGWTVVPGSDDQDYPVPPAWFNPTIQGFLPYARLKRMKSDVFYRKRFTFWQGLFTDPGFLRSVSLGELGVLIELTIHNVMHLRWASSPGSSLPNPDEPTQVESTIPQEWDDPRFDFLGETYSSHVNPVFWKIHGWIDDRVENWKVANGVVGNDFWKGTWVGKMPGHEHAAEQPAGTGVSPDGGHVHQALEEPAVAAGHLAEVEEVVRVVRRSTVTHVPFAQVPVG